MNYFDPFILLAWAGVSNLDIAFAAVKTAFPLRRIGCFAWEKLSAWENDAPVKQNAAFADQHPAGGPFLIIVGYSLLATRLQLGSR